MKRLFRFNREEDDFGTYRWYIDLPEYSGLKADLEMVSGADIMLDKLSLTDSVDCVISDGSLVDWDLLLEPLGEEGYYITTSHKMQYDGISVWLCEVTKFVFGYYPENIYIKVV